MSAGSQLQLQTTPEEAFKNRSSLVDKKCAVFAVRYCRCAAGSLGKRIGAQVGLVQALLDSAAVVSTCETASGNKGGEGGYLKAMVQMSFWSTKPGAPFQG